MPDYKTHSIHSELVFNNIRRKTDIDLDKLKIFSFGPDSLISTNYKLFDYQHSHKTKDYFESLLKYIKDNKLQDNSEVMSFLYGQLDHFILDIIIHPLIYYMTEKMPVRYRLKPHTLLELWISDYVMTRYQKDNKNYYSSMKISRQLKDVINNSYKKVYKKDNVASQYESGISHIITFDSIRFSDDKLLKRICNRLKIGDFFYKRNGHKARKFLNFKHEIITNPVTGDEFKSSFDDLWTESIDVASELIDDVNRYLYLDRPLSNYFINGNISYNTGLPCSKEEKFRFVRKYKQ